ncbi:MAG: hypothetical protein WBO10_09635 [Pyrinomonadaceae bacterium]
MIQKFTILVMIVLFGFSSYAQVKHGLPMKYPIVWFAAINDLNKPGWEILPQEAKAGEVILSKRNELGILSNFAALK